MMGAIRARGVACMGDRRVIQTVLVADDDLQILDAFRLALERSFNVTVVTATSLEAAVRLARQHHPQLAIVDLQLGRDSGLELIRYLRAADAAIALVLITGYGSVDVAVRAVKAGANEVIEKPVRVSEIFARLRGVADDGPLETPSADRALWEHVQRVLADCGGNKSETARRLRKPRSWLRRFLSRAAP